ncbi:MAG TPA: SUMF1/EgtB/PvdO family nonheme iron enzyme, partial [Blastocatellia bacterium]|nr:SUMF1/EgtB/PvdO family nonheme iron enzyme [Blastocatellia bacterium]
MAVKPNPALVRAEWEADRIHPPLAEVIAGLKRLEWLPALKQTGWEETTLTAAPMAADPSGFIRALMPHNLPLAARCAVAAESRLGNELKREIQTALLERMRNPQAEVRARIAAGEALGLLGDPRFELHDGKHGRYLLPPLATIPAGRYTIGNDNGKYGDEKPQCEVELPEFQIGRFPITNAEYKLFIEAGGYKDEGWWQTQQARAWLRKQEDHQPSRWNDAESNNPLQPVVGVSWFEACAYCCWLTAMAANGDVFRLPTEAEFEAAARGKQARLYPYGDEFDADRCNTREGTLDARRRSAFLTTPRLKACLIFRAMPGRGRCLFTRTIHTEARTDAKSFLQQAAASCVAARGSSIHCSRAPSIVSTFFRRTVTAIPVFVWWCCVPLLPELCLG